MTLSTTLLTALATTSNGPRLPFGGYGQTSPALPSTTNSILLGGTGTTDQYLASNVAYQGFYLKSANTVTLTSTVIFGVGPSGNSNNLTVTQTQYDGTVPTGIVTSRSFSYYYDSLTTTPSITYLSDVITNSNMIQVSGIYVAYSTLTVGISSIATNMGNYFYTNPLMTYTLTLGSFTTTSTITGLPAGTGTQITGPLTFAPSFLTSPNITTNAIYTQAVSLSAVARNPYTNSATVSNNISTIVDGPSYSLVYTTLAQSIPLLSNATIIAGRRCWSAGSALTATSNYNNTMVNTPTYVPAYSFVTPTTVSISVPSTFSTFSQVAYNNAWYLTDSGSVNTGGYDATTELDVANGLFITPRTTLSDNVTRVGYKSYSPYFGNTTVSPTSLINYTSIAATGYRYTTFVWSVSPKSGAYGATLTFTLYNVKNIVAAGTSPTYAQTSVGNPVYLLYRFEDQSNIFPVNNIPPGGTFSNYNFGPATFTTIWLNGNAIDPTANIGSGNYYQTLTTDYPTSAYVRGGFSGFSVASGTATFTVYTNTPVVNSGTTLYLYCRIGLPMSDDAGFSYCGAKLT